jgi:hypothetical protein
LARAAGDFTEKVDSTTRIVVERDDPPPGLIIDHRDTHPGMIGSGISGSIPLDLTGEIPEFVREKIKEVQGEVIPAGDTPEIDTPDGE